MKFSVLLPTRNRLNYLRYAVESVRRQEYEDWEIVISDNCSEDDIAGYVAELKEPRIRYVRTQDFIPVTENWNNALENSEGDYVIMLGDDDGLVPGYFTAMKRLIDEYEAPDFIYTGALMFSYPGVTPAHPDGYLMPYGYANFLNDSSGPLKKPIWIEKQQALELVEESMDFRAQYGYNMQFALISRKFVQSLSDKGPFFQSPFPDYYAMNVMFLKAKRILADARPMVMIGVTPKSYGFYFLNGREKEGVSFLKGESSKKIAQRLKRFQLPGTHINNGWLAAVETIRFNYPEFGLKVGYWRYRMSQTLHVYHGYRTHNTVSYCEYRELMRKLRLDEKIQYGFCFALLVGLKKLLPARWHATTVNRLREKWLEQFPAGSKWAPELTVGRYQNMLEVFEDLPAQT
ncbi:glycosyltransferase family 2 protein [bacterium]|nr:MAG: glycosyltransferase family 2 protein [bacterium]